MKNLLKYKSPFVSSLGDFSEAGGLIPFQKPGKAVMVRGSAMPPMVMDQAYDNYVATYSQVTGKYWSKPRYLARARGWNFYGSTDGYVAARQQRSGGLKLTTAAGNPDSPNRDKSMKAAFAAVLSERKPTWGLVSKHIASFSRRAGFLTLPPKLVVSMFAVGPTGEQPIIPEFVVVGKGSSYKVGRDGTLTIQDPELGSEKKYIIGNQQWLDLSIQLIDDRISKMGARIGDGTSGADAATYQERTWLTSVRNEIAAIIGQGKIAAPVLQIASERTLKELRRSSSYSIDIDVLLRKGFSASRYLNMISNLTHNETLPVKIARIVKGNAEVYTDEANKNTGLYVPVAALINEQ